MFSFAALNMTLWMKHKNLRFEPPLFFCSYNLFPSRFFFQTAYFPGDAPWTHAISFVNNTNKAFTLTFAE